MAVGLYIGRRVRGSSDFFVARRQLGPGLIFSTMLAANIGAGSTLGCIVGGLVITVYFAAGGLLTSVRVNVIQLAVKLAGFAIALPLAVSATGGWSALAGVRAGDASYWTFWRTGPPGVMYLASLM